MLGIYLKRFEFFSAARIELAEEFNKLQPVGAQKKVNPMRQMCLPHIQAYDKCKIAGKITDSFSYHLSPVVF